MKFTVYEGREKPIVVCGKNCCRIAIFAEKYRGWHYSGNDIATKNALKSLVKRGAVVANEFGQFAWHTITEGEKQ